MWRSSYNARPIYETPSLIASSTDELVRRQRADSIIQQVRKSDRTLLTEFESKKVLEAYDIPTVETHIAASVDDAVKIADKLGYPVVLKLHSETITHKTDVGGVQLNLKNAAAVRRAWKAIETSVARLTGHHDTVRSSLSSGAEGRREEAA